MPEVQPPIFVVDGSDVSVHASLNDVLDFVEGPDIEVGSYGIFDSIGRRITLRAENLRTTRWTVDPGTVRLEHVERTAEASEELRKLLADALRACGRDVPEIISLSEVVEIARQVFD